MRNLIAAALALVTFSAYAHDPAWITYGPDGPRARALVVGGSECPDITIDGARHRMRTHALPGKNYPVLTCEHRIPEGTRSVSIGERVLPVHKLGRTAKVAIIGDTGCRIALSHSGGPPKVTDCADPKAWPFEQVADTIAKWDPDVILNVGDYYYREATRLKGGNWVKSTYNWTRWNADWFLPAAKLLPNAPWVLVRGNHEDCDRAAEGWFRFLDPRPYLYESQKMCKSNLEWTPPYDVRVGDMRVIVYDSSGISDWKVDPDQVKLFAGQLGLYAGDKADGAWMMLHHPFWGYGSYGAETETMWTAWNAAGTSAPEPDLMLTGHMHLLALLGFADKRIPQFVVGNSGTSLDAVAKEPPSQPIGGRTVTDFYTDGDFGWIAATHEGSNWTFDVRDKNGNSVKTCTWSPNNALTCQ